MRRKLAAEWNVTELERNKPAGIEIEHHALDNNTTLIHFKFAKTLSGDDLSRYAASVRKALPANAMAIFSPKDEVDIVVDRPAGSLDIKFDQCTFDTAEELDKLYIAIEAARDKGANVKISLTGCTIKCAEPCCAPTQTQSTAKSQATSVSSDPENYLFKFFPWYT